MTDLFEGILTEFVEQQSRAAITHKTVGLRVTVPQQDPSYWRERRAWAARLRPERKAPKSKVERQRAYVERSRELINARRRIARAVQRAA